MDLKGKVCIITGSGNGIGKATALKFGRYDAIVAVCDIRVEDVNNVVNEIRKNGGTAEGYRVDVTQKEEISFMVNDLKSKYGRIDVLINNAGIILDAQLVKMSEEQWDKVVDVNLKGTFLCTKAVIETMIEQGSGSIINTSSIVGVYGNFGQTNYAATKWGVIGMAKTWAKELGRKGIRSNVVAPGFISTPILESMPEKVINSMIEKVPMKRLGQPDEIAEVYAFLASDLASYINGAVIEVSGGVTL